MKSIQLNRVTKSFGGHDVIRPIDLDIEAGQFTVFVGPSGCGKSTLLRLIAGLEETTSGQIDIGGRDVTRLPPVDRDVAMVFQSYALYPHMSVGENIAFGLKIAGMPKAERVAKARETAATLKLEGLFDRKPKALSGGQRQRVAIGRAIVKNPSIFLFDEPLSNLDAELRVQMRQELVRLHQEVKATMIYVTHDQVEAMTMAEKIVVLRAGEIEQVGSPMELYENPRNMFVAGFIGSPKMNFLDGRVVACDRQTREISLDAFEGRTIQVLARETAGPLRAGDKVKVGVRPQHLRVDPDGPLSVTTATIEALGNLTYLYADMGNDQPLCVETRGPRPRVGDALRLSVDPADALIFDEIGLRI